MLFEYSQPRFYSFWMKGMRFDIDIVWIRQGRIVEISHLVPYPRGAPDGAALPTYRPREVGDTVLEVPAGYAQAHGWRRGDRITISRSP